MTPTEIARLAAIVWNVRPEWQQTSLHTLISRNLAAKPYHLAVVAFIACAVDPDTKTPARVLENGPWWRAAAIAFGYEPATPIPLHRDDLHCKRCGLLRTDGEDHQCQRVADAHEGAARARQALAAARNTRTDTEEEHDA